MTPTWPQELEIRPLTTADAADIVTWRYGGDWAIYDSSPNDPLSAENGYWAVAGRDGGELVGFCCFGAQARVPELAAKAGVEDVGVGMRPLFTGQGHGTAFAAAVLDFARSREGVDRLRLLVQSWNTRSLRLWLSLGFAETDRLTMVRKDHEVEFIILERD